MWNSNFLPYYKYKLKLYFFLWIRDKKSMQLLLHRMPIFDLPSSFPITWNSKEPWNPVYCSLLPGVPTRSPAALRLLYSTCMESTALKPSKILDTGTSKIPVLIFRYLPGGDQILFRTISKFTAGCKHVKFSLCCPKWGGLCTINFNLLCSLRSEALKIQQAWEKHWEQMKRLQTKNS